MWSIIGQLRPALWVVVFIFGFQLIFTDGDQVAIALALAIQAIPLMVDTVRQVEEVRRA